MSIRSHVAKKLERKFEGRLTNEECIEIFDLMVDEIRGFLLSGKKVIIRGLGTFSFYKGHKWNKTNMIKVRCKVSNTIIYALNRDVLGMENPMDSRELREARSKDKGISGLFDDL